MMKKELKEVGFRRLWIGETVSVFGSQFTQLAVPLTAATVFVVSPFEMGALNAANSAAVLVFGLSAGVIADRSRKRRIMVIGNLVRAGALIAIPLLYWAGLLNVWGLVGMMFVIGLGGVLTDCAYSAFVYELVPRKHLNAANAWTQGSSSASDVAGPGLAGLLFQWLGGPIVLLIDAVSYLINSLFLLTLPPGRPPEAPPQASHWSDLKDGVAATWNQRVLRLSTLAAAHSNFFHSMYFAIFVLFVVTRLNLSAGLIGAAMSVSGVFGVLGARMAAPLAERWGHGRVLAVVYAVPGVAALLVPAALGRSTGMALFMVTTTLALWTFAVVINLVLSESIKQAFAKPDEISRVTASVRVISWGVEPVGALLGGVLATTLMSQQSLLYLAAVGLASASAWVLPSEVRQIHTLDQDGTQSDSEVQV